MGLDTLTVVVIDDSPEASAVMQTLLSSNGIHCICYSDATETRQIEQIADISIIFLDLDMGGVATGYALFDYLTSLPHLDKVPIIVYSAHTSEMANARRKGFDGFLGKPFRTSDFKTILQTIQEGGKVWTSRD